MQHKIENEELPAKKPILHRALVCIMLVSAFVAESSLVSYKNFQGTAQSIYADEQKAVEDFKRSTEYKAREIRLQSDLAKLDNSSKAKEQRNAIALRIKGERTDLYSGEIREDIEKATRLRAEFDAWVATQLVPIRARFEDKRIRASENSFIGFVSGVSFSWFVPLLVISLGYLSTLQDDQWRWVLLGLSFVPQLLSSQMAYYGALLKFGQEHLAVITGIVFFLCLPPLYHFGIMELRSKKLVCMNKSKPAPDHAGSGKLTHTSTTLEFELTDEGYKKAVRLIAKEKNAGNGKGLFANALRKFEPVGVTKSTLCRDIKRAREGRDVKRNLKMAESKIIHGEI